jgi:hypothetical protein
MSVFRKISFHELYLNGKHVDSSSEENLNECVVSHRQGQ